MKSADITQMPIQVFEFQLDSFVILKKQGEFSFMLFFLPVFAWLLLTYWDNFGYY